MLLSIHITDINTVSGLYCSLSKQSCKFSQGACFKHYSLVMVNTIDELVQTCNATEVRVRRLE